MMNPFIEFYQTPLGETAARFIAAQIRAMWQSPPPQIYGVGEAQGLKAHLWAESDWQFCDNAAALDKNCAAHMILIHLLCDASNDHGANETLLHEAARASEAMGRLILVVPNWRGFWARSTTPFNAQYAVNLSHLEALMRSCNLHILTIRPALLLPPRRLAGFGEVAGRYLWRGLGGAWIIDAQKRIPARHNKRAAFKWAPHMALRPLVNHVAKRKPQAQQSN